ncbi:MAG: vWA domain-containing protein [Nitrososphaerota archaeon]
MTTQVHENIIRLFNQAWVELHCPPVRLVLEDEKQSDSVAPVSVANGTVHLKTNVVPRGSDPEKFLLWFFRHEMAHVHHCPYDIKTAYSLERAAQKVVGDWNLAYLATHIFSDVQVNLNYLPRRFGELPYQVRIIENRRLTSVEEILQGIYHQVHPTFKPMDKQTAKASREILTIAMLDKPWHTKVQLIAIILSKLRERRARLFSHKRTAKSIKNHTLHVKEDFLPGSLEMFRETYGTISDKTEARAFFEQWIEPRLSREEKERITKMAKEKLEGQKGRRKKEDRTSGRSGQKHKHEKPGKLRDDSDESSVQQLLGEEPHLSTSLSKPYEKIRSEVMNDALWRRYWYRSRAEQTIIQYLSESPSRRPVWAVMKYPDEWYIEDNIESLDVEMSLDEGPLIPEVTTLKWVEEPTSHGQSLVTGFVPSAITVLDASRSMSGIRDEAATAAFIAYLSARRAGGQTANLTFSTNYVSADWNSPEEMKELVLSMSFDEFTVFPAFEITRLISENPGECFIVVITDGGWQNIDEAVPHLERIADLGHKIVIFHLPGGFYPDRIKLMERIPGIKIYQVNEPETELQGLVLSETMRTYEAFLTSSY